MSGDIKENIKYYFMTQKPELYWWYKTNIRGKILNHTLYKEFLQRHKKLSMQNDIMECARFMKTNGTGLMFPYSWSKKYFFMNVPILDDDGKGLKYVIHNGKNLYFPQNWKRTDILQYYRNLCVEQDGQSPHQYFGNGFNIDEKDVFVDVGAAEGLIALENIDKVQKCYLVECDMDWAEALEATFAPYKEKVVISLKRAADFNDEETTTLDMLVKERERVCVKIDVEGFEEEVLNGAQKIMSGSKMKFAVCCYHKGADREYLSRMLGRYFQNVFVVPGYVYFPWDKHGERIARTMPYLRSAIIRVY